MIAGLANCSKANKERGRRLGRPIVRRLKSRDPSSLVPDLKRVPVKKLARFLHRCRVIGAVDNHRRAADVAVSRQGVDSILGHGRDAKFVTSH